MATVGLQGQRVDPRRRWHNWKNRGGNLAGGCVRDALTAEGVLQEGVVADGVEGGVEGPVQPAQHGQQQQSGERLQELRDLPRSSGEGWARSPLRASARPRSGPRLARGPHQVLHFQGLDGGVVGEDDGLLLGLAERQQSPLALGEKLEGEGLQGPLPLPAALLEGEAAQGARRAGPGPLTSFFLRSSIWQK